MTCKRDALAHVARIMPRPILLRIEIEPSEDDKARIFKIPFYQATVVCVDVDWGDGCVDKLREKGDAYIEHTYAASGEYTVCVFPANGREKPSGRFLDHLGFLTEIYSWRSTAAWWRPLRQIISLGRVGLQSLSYLFAYCDVFNVDLQHLSVGDITDMSGMFYLSKFNQPICDWNVSNVTNMRHMFACAPAFNQPIGKWDVSKVTDMSFMFWDAGDFDQPIGDWDVSNATNLSHMFHCASNFNQPIGKWNVHKVTDFAGLFSCAVAFNQPIGEWDVRNATNMNDTFRSTRSFNQSIGKWNVCNVTSMRYMFDGAPVFNQDISGWNVSKSPI
jgi:surface protein